MSKINGITLYKVLKSIIKYSKMEILMQVKIWQSKTSFYNLNNQEANLLPKRKLHIYSLSLL